MLFDIISLSILDIIKGELTLSCDIHTGINRIGERNSWPSEPFSFQFRNPKAKYSALSPLLSINSFDLCIKALNVLQASCGIWFVLYPFGKISESPFASLSGSICISESPLFSSVFITTGNLIFPSALENRFHNSSAEGDSIIIEDRETRLLILLAGKFISLFRLPKSSSFFFQKSTFASILILSPLYKVYPRIIETLSYC